jgi:23S rRNA (pseudouridine1915-N3)-methyltransferase
MPTYINEGVNEYLKRLKEFAIVHLLELPLMKRQQGIDTLSIQKKEHYRLLEVIPKDSYIMALDVNGKSFTSESLAIHLEKRHLITSHISFVIGGPEGFLPQFFDKANESISLSSLTFPHPIARLVLTEAIYRAFTIIHHHPYHRF